MSYPYDVNPWDDNYNPNAPVSQTPVQQGGYSAENYSTAQYSDQSYSNQYQYQDQQQQQQQGYYPNDQQQQSQQSQQQATEEQGTAKPEQAERSALNRFLRNHVPLCGSILDTLSGINLPFIDALVQHVNRDLLVSKMFYFFFYSAFGSLFPLMGVYFKQLGMNPAQVGILTGVRPFIEIFSAPFWSSLADKFHKSKALLLFSLLSWIIFTYSLAHIRPPASACVAFNDTDFLLYTPYSNNELSNIDVGKLDEDGNKEAGEKKSNEVFMDRMPVGAIAEAQGKEGKDEILASEENQNDQRRRRRRKRQATFGGDDPDQNSHIKKRYLYSLDGANDDDLKGRLELDVDLENDFDDALIGGQREQLSKRNGRQHSSYELDSDNENAPEYDELEQLYSKGSRLKRSAAFKEADDFLGESDESPEEEPTLTDKNEEQQKANGRREKVRERQKGKGGWDEGSNEEEDEQEGGETEGEGKDTEIGGYRVNNGSTGGSGKMDPGPLKSNKQPQIIGGSMAPETASKTGMPANNKGETFYESVAQDDTTKGKEVNTNVNKTRRVFKQRHKTPPTHIVGMSPITVEYAVNYKKERHSQFVAPMFSTIVYKLDDIKEVFFLLLLLISLGEFFSAPALTLADSATLGYLGENTDLYGRQRMFGSLSWAITLLLVGMALDNATSIADHPCGPHQRERSYTVCFAIFSLLMACAFLTATQFRFNYPKKGTSTATSGTDGQALMTTATSDSKSVVTTSVDNVWSGTGAGTGNIDDLYSSTQPRSIFNTAPPVNAPPPNIEKNNNSTNAKEKFEFLDKWKSAVFAQTGQLPEWVNVFRQFRNSLHLTYLFITWFLGCGVGLVFTFLFWHLQDVGGTPTLFGICSVINHISEILAYFFSFSFIKRFGHTRVLSVGLGCNVIRFLYVAFLTNPYYALPFELVQGITHAACFAACCSYISHVSKPELRTSTQGVMQGLHHGIGRACGALIGGYMINAIGSRASFCIYGLLSGCVLAGFLYVRKKASQVEDEREVKVDDSEALGGYGAPQGVPTAVL